jgi:ribonuclease VapC
MKRYVVDTSALVAICLDEPEAAIMRNVMAEADELFISAPSLLELGIVGLQRDIAQEAIALLKGFEVEVIAFDEPMAHAANAAFERYGKGRHRAALNFGDCCSYALAKQRDLSLLYKGNDFAQTDITSALA